MNSAEFAGPDWFEHSRAATAGLLTARPGLDARIQYDADAGEVHHRWLQVIADGQLDRWEPGELTDADVEICWTLTDARDVLAGKLDGTRSMEVMTIVGSTSKGVYRGPPPPMDLVRHSELAQLPTIEGATLTVQHLLKDGPFGDLPYAQVFVDGHLNRMTLGTLADPDVSVELPYRDMVRLREGTIAVLDALEHGNISGSTGSLALFAGLLESEPYQRAQRASVHRAGRALAALGEINATPGYRAALAEVTLDADTA